MPASATNRVPIAATFIAGTIAAMRPDTFNSSNDLTTYSQPIPAIHTATAVGMTDTGRHTTEAHMAVLSAGFANLMAMVAASALAIGTMDTDLVTAADTLATATVATVTDK